MSTQVCTPRCGSTRTRRLPLYPVQLCLPGHQRVVCRGAETVAHLAVTGQVRQDWVDNNAPTTWRLGGVFEATRSTRTSSSPTAPRSERHRCSIATAWTLFGYASNPLLQPEYSQGWETGFTTDLAAFGRSDFVSLNGTYFAQTVRNLIVGVYSPIDTAVNVGSAFVHGVEAELRVRATSWLEFHATYTLTTPMPTASPRARARSCCAGRRTRRRSTCG